MRASTTRSKIAYDSHVRRMFEETIRGGYLGDYLGEDILRTKETFFLILSILDLRSLVCSTPFPEPKRQFSTLSSEIVRWCHSLHFLLLLSLAPSVAPYPPPLPTSFSYTRRRSLASLSETLYTAGRRY